VENKMADRFDLEQEIMNCWTIVDDLDFFYRHSALWSQEDKTNYIVGLKTKYQYRFENLFDIFEECIAKDQFKKYEPKIKGQPKCFVDELSGKDLDDAYDELPRPTGGGIRKTGT